MAALALTVVAGVLCGQFWFPPLPAGGVVLAMLGLAPATWWLLGWRSAVWLLALGWSGLHGSWYLDALPVNQGQPIDTVVQGCVDDFPRSDANGQVFTIQTVADPVLSGAALRVRLRTYDTEPLVTPTSCWQLRVRLKVPHGQSNPGQFDRAAWLYRQGIHATGYVRTSALQRAVYMPELKLTTLRWRSQLLGQLPELEGRGAELLPGLVVGARSNISPELWELFRLTGTSHLMAISGLHIGMIAWVCWQLGAVIARVLRAPRPQRLGAWTAAAGALTYAAMAGLSVATVRAAGMVVVMLVLQSRHRRYAPKHAFWTLLFLSSASHPVTVLAPGFWLSYLAVGVLLFGLSRPAPSTRIVPAKRRRGAASAIFNRVRAAPAALRGAAYTQIFLCMALLLPGVLFFGQIAWLAALVNLLVIPFFAVLVMPLILLGTLVTLLLGPVPGGCLLQVSATLLTVLLNMLEWAGRWPQSVWLTSGLAVSDWLLAGTGVALCLVRLPVARPLPGLVLLTLALRGELAPESQALRLQILDVGQGTAVLVTQGAHAALFDTGPAWRGSDAAVTTLLPVLRYQGINQLDWVAISHADADHAGGFSTLLRDVEVDSLLVPAEMLSAANRPAWLRAHIVAKRAHVCQRGQRLRWAGAELVVEHPRNPAGLQRNDSSCVLTLRFGAATVWFPGDIQATGEALLVARTAPAPAALVVVPHHGSTSSSGPGYVALTRPTFAVITSGFMNRWGFPAASVVRRWASSGACVLTTAKEGGLEFAIRKDGSIRLLRRYGAGWRRPWPVRAAHKPRCNTIKRGSRGV